VTEDLLTQTFERMLLELCPPEVVRAAESGKDAEALQAAVAESGLAWLGQPASQGGSGGTVHDAAALVHLIGRHVAPTPLPDQWLVGGWLLASAGLLLPADGVSVAPGRPEDTATARAVAGGWRLAGSVHRVPWGRTAGAVALVVPGDRPVVAVVLASEFEIDHGFNLAGEPRDNLTFDVVLGPDQAGVAPDRASLELAARGALCRVILMAGCLERVLEMTVAYAGSRVQFGRPISKFQAVAQNLALLAEEVLQAQMAAELAVEALAGGDVVQEAGAAKTVAGASAGEGSRLAHQIHGAIGTTAEYDLQLFTRRLLAWRDEFGSERMWATKLGRTLLRAGEEGTWDLCVAPSNGPHH
jgi:acyl-CoA dehydrogenase